MAITFDDLPDSTTAKKQKNAITFDDLPQASVLSRLGQDLQGRANNQQQIMDDPRLNSVAKTLGVVGNVGSATGDFVTASYRGLMSVAPENVKRGETALLQAAAPLAARVGEIAEPVTSRLQTFAKNNPNIATSAEGLLGIAQLLPVAKPIGKATEKVVGAPVGYVASGSKNIVKGMKARTPDMLDNVVSSIKDQASQSYKKSRDLGAVLNRNRAVSIVNNIEASLSDSGKLHPRLHGDTMSVIKEMRQAAKKGDFSLEELDQYRKLLSGVSNKNKIANQEDAFKAIKAINALDDEVDSLQAIDIVGGKKEAVDALLEGRASWAKAKKFETISDIVKKSDGDANYLKRELKKLADNPKKTKGFTKDELNALMDASKLSGGEGLLKMLGKFGFDAGNSRIGSGVGALVGAGASGAAFGTGAGLAAPIVGTAARYGQKFAARGKTEELLKIIESGGKVTNKQIMTLPPKQAKALLSAINAAKTKP